MTACDSCADGPDCGLERHDGRCWRNDGAVLLGKGDRWTPADGEDRRYPPGTIYVGSSDADGLTPIMPGETRRVGKALVTNYGTENERVKP